jgi:myosin heavy subunit
MDYFTLGSNVPKLKQLEAERDRRFQEYVITIQSAYRMHTNKKYYISMKKSMIKIQAGLNCVKFVLISSNPYVAVQEIL